VRSKLTIIIPMYNASLYLKQTIDSIKNQNYRDFTAIILDDCSSDDSYRLCKELIDGDMRFEIFRNQNNQGYLHSTNILLSLVKSDYCAFWDADDTGSEDRLLRQVYFLDNNSNIDLVGSYANLIDSNSKLIRKVKYPSQITIDNFNVCGSSVMFRANILRTIGLYNPLFSRMGSEDFEWLMRASLQFKYYCIPEYLYNYRRLTTSLTLNGSNSPSFLYSHHLVASLFRFLEGRLVNGYWDDESVQAFFTHECKRLEAEEKLHPKGRLYQVLECHALEANVRSFYNELFHYLKRYYMKANLLSIIKYNVKLWLRVFSNV